ncbi:MAG: YihY/virulence factor BrkB family protein [Gemmatimonadetes bacterium]|nr:YihY/virulence factor BrkB family protein [Gemmatimonadota bacterium]
MVDADAATGQAPAGAGPADPLTIPPPRPGTRPEDRSLGKRLRSYLGDVAGGVWNKGAQDNIFFLAGAIAFNVLVAFIPLLIAIIGIAGTVLRGQRVRNQLIGYLDQVVPAPVAEYLNYGELLRTLTESSTGILSVGTLFFLWIATRLVGTLRAVLSEIFDTPETRGIVAGKIFDIKMVFMAGTLFLVNMFLSWGLQIGAGAASELTGIQPEEIPFLGQATNLWPHLLAFGTIWVMFLLVYRYLPPRRIKWSTAVIAATFTSVVGEALKYGFTAYVQNLASFGDLWGAVATFVILVLWIYYTSVVFILGGEVGHVVTMNRIRKRQKERLW